MRDLVQCVLDQTQAYNDKDLDKLLDGLAEGYESYIVGPGGATLRASGRAQVAERIGQLFAATGYAESRVEDVRAYGQLAVALEIDTFDTPQGRRTMRSVGLYEFTDGKLARAWSFPVRD